jgi:hypothetical protein
MLSPRRDCSERRRAPRPPARGQGARLTDGQRISRHRTRIDALAERILLDPPGVEHDVEVVLRDRDRCQQDRRDVDAAGCRERRGVRDARRVRVLAQRDGGLAGGGAELAGVLPDVDRLRAERDAVERRLVAVLTGHGDLAGEALGLEGRDDAARHAVVLREHRVDVVVLGGQELLHLRLGDRGVPVVGVGLADDLDVARRDCLTDDLLVPVTQEVGVRVGSVALDDDVLALGHLGEHGLGLHPADLDVVERDVQDTGVLDQTVVRDDGHTVGDGVRDGRLDGGAVLGEDHEHVGALRDQVLDVAGLGLGGRLGVVRHVAAAAGLDRSLQRRLVPLRPALFLVVVPRHADDAAVATAARCGRTAGGRRCRRGPGGFRAFVLVVVAARGHDQCRADQHRGRSPYVHRVPPLVCAADRIDP